jgi:competence protein ComEA
LTAPTTVVPSGNPPGGDAPVSAQRGPLTLRQKVLIGNRLDINRATTAEISELPGISDAVAASVVAERQRRGVFRSPRELLGVPGIKAKRLEKILPFLSEMENN